MTLTLLEMIEGCAAESWELMKAERDKTPNSGNNPTPESESTSPPLIQIVDWELAFNRPACDAIVDGLVFPGRWTALIAPAKHGKSTLALHIAHRLSRGLDPFGPGRCEPVKVLYLDGEMGEVDVVDRMTNLDLTPDQLTTLYYTDRFPKGDTIQGGAAIVSTAKALGIGLVILDGLNAFVSGAEKDDTPWRNLYEQTIAPLKRAGVATVSSDNTGKDTTLSARGSSVKLDKADAIIELKRIDNGIALKTTHQRSADYTRSVDLVMEGLDGEEPIDYRRTMQAWPAGTRDAADTLERLGVPVDYGRNKARQMLRDAGQTMQNSVLTAALKLRKQETTRRDNSWQNLSADRDFEASTDRSNGQGEQDDF